jgi:hypothetical protein
MLTGDARALLQAEAYVRGVAVPATARRHVRLEPSPTVFVPLSLAGEDGALLAFGTSRARGQLELFVCPEPRDHALSAILLGRLATWTCRWLDPLAADREPAVTRRHGEALVARKGPQLVVPTQAAAVLLRRLAERLLWRSSREDPTLARAGGWWLFFCDRHEVAAGDSTLLVMTEALQQHVVPPISPAESEHLLALTATLAPPPGLSAVAAAALQEDEAGSTLTTPRFDRDHLEPAIARYNRARRGDDPSGADAAEAQIESLLRPIVARLADACHEGIAFLRGIEPIPPVQQRRALAERHAFARHADYLDKGGLFAREDSLRRGLFFIDGAENELRCVTYEARVHDPVLRAVATLAGEALDGTLLRSTVIKVQGLKNKVERLQLELQVDGPWRPCAESFDLLHLDTFFRFEIEDCTVSDAQTCVRLRSSNTFRKAVQELAPALAPGDRLGLVASYEEFLGVPVPAQPPWMLTRGGP